MAKSAVIWMTCGPVPSAEAASTAARHSASVPASYVVAAADPVTGSQVADTTVATTSPPRNPLTRGTLPRQGQRATKYLARGWWQIRADVVCSGWYCQLVSSLQVTPMRSAPSSSATFALSSRSGHAG